MTASDRKLTSPAANVDLVVNPMPDDPVAREDVGYAITPPPSLTVPVLDNDFDVDGEGLTVMAVSQGTLGSVTTNGTTISYVPQPGFQAGTDQFTYTIQDSSGATAVGKVAIHLGQLKGGDWPLDARDPQHTGYYPSSMGANLQEAWYLPGSSFGSPALCIGDKVYFNLYLQASGSPGLYALDKKTGAVLWTRNFGLPLRLNFTVYHEGTLYLLVGRQNTLTPSLQAIDAETGSTLWSQAFLTSGDEKYAPLVTSAGIWAHAEDVQLFGFDLNGVKRFNRSASDNGFLYTWDLITLKELNPLTGALLRSVSVGTGTPSYDIATVISGNRAYLGSGSQISCVDLSTMKLLWQYTPGGTMTTSPVYRAWRVYAQFSGKIYCLDSEIGVKLLECLFPGEWSLAYNIRIWGRDHGGRWNRHGHGWPGYPCAGSRR